MGEMVHPHLCAGDGGLLISGDPLLGLFFIDPPIILHHDYIYDYLGYCMGNLIQFNL